MPLTTLPATPLAEVYDVAVIGGGINGVGIAADAAGRGLSVFLCEKDDLASHTSSASSKLIHGGLRYLEHYEIRLVREQWPFFRTRIDMLEMVLAKADADIARLYDERLVQPDLLPLGVHLRDLLSQACSVVLGLTGQSQLLAHSPDTLEFIRLRNTYLDPLHLLQAELLARSRQQEAAQDSPLEQALLVRTAGVTWIIALQKES